MLVFISLLLFIQFRTQGGPSIVNLPYLDNSSQMCPASCFHGDSKFYQITDQDHSLFLQLLFKSPRFHR